MIILMPMAGKGTRFSKEGYKTNKASIPTFNRHTGELLNMVTCSLLDIPESRNSSSKIICISKDFHANDGTEQEIRDHFTNPIFIHDHVMLDQAFGCYLAREHLLNEEDLFIGACDTGFNMDIIKFQELKQTSDCIVLTHSNDKNIASNPNAHSWLVLAQNKNQNRVLEISLKQTVSKDYMNDYATTGLFWFKHSYQFINLLEEMIWNKDNLNGKYYIDQLINYYLKEKLKVNFININYFGWGTPEDYEAYQACFKYWESFHKKFSKI